MKAIQKNKLSDERIKLVAQLKAKDLKGRDKIIASKRITEIVTLLTGAKSAEDTKTEVGLSPFERIVQNGEITIENLRGAVESTKMLLNSVSTPKVFLDAVQIVSAKLSDGSLMDSLGQPGLDLIVELDQAINLIEDDGQNVRDIATIEDILFTSGWAKSIDGFYSQSIEQFTFLIKDKGLGGFDVEVYQNQAYVKTITSKGQFVHQVIADMNQFIQIEGNKLRFAQSPNDVILTIEHHQENINDLSPITIIDALANGSNTSRQNEGETPTQEQLLANDYKTAKVVIAGMQIAIENPIGSVRRGVDEKGVAWETTMTAHYGYFENTLGADGDELDVFIMHNVSQDYEGRIFVINQLDADGNFDEHKVIIGAVSKVIANQVYRSHYDENFQGQGGIIELSIEDFKTRVFTGSTAMLDSVQKNMLDSWSIDGSYDLIPISKLEVSQLGDGSKEAKASIKEPIVVYLIGAKNYVIHGRKRLDIAIKSGERFIPSIVFDAKMDYTRDDIKKAFRKSGNIVHAEALGALIELIATDRAEKELG